MRTKWILLLLTCVFMLGACHKQNGKNNGKTKPVEVEVVESTNNPALLNDVKGLFDKKEKFSTVEVSFNLKLNSPERNVSASGQLRIANDSVIWLYVKAVGFEIARAKFTRDSVAAVVKLKNQYFKGDYSAMQRYLPVAVDFTVLQSIFMNEIFIFPENKVDNLSYFNFSDDENFIKVSSFGNPDYAKSFGFNYLFNVVKSINRVKSALVQMPKNNKTVNIVYSDYEEVAGHLHPNVMTITMDDTEVTFTTTKITYEKKLNYPLTIPSSYKPFEF